MWMVILMKNYLLHPDPDEKAQDKNNYLKLARGIIPDHHLGLYNNILLSKIITIQNSTKISWYLLHKLATLYLLTRSFVRCIDRIKWWPPSQTHCFFYRFCKGSRPVEANAKHSILAEGGYEEVDVLGSSPESGQGTFLQGDLPHPGRFGDEGFQQRFWTNLHLSLFWRVSDVE